MNEEELIVEEPKPGQAEFYLATVSEGTAGEGIKIILDGQDSAMAKPYKILVTGKSPPRSGERVLVVKISGTYIVLGAVTLPGSWWNCAPLSNSATLANVITRINSIGSMFADTGIAKNDAT